MDFVSLIIFISSFGKCLSYFFDNVGLNEDDIKYYLKTKIPETPAVDSINGNIYIPYLFDSGVGNRDTLVINDIGVDERFPFGKGVLSWREITFGGMQYLVGRQKNGVNLIQIKIKQFTHQHFNTLYFNETFMYFEGTVGPIILINYLNFTSGLEEGFALVTELTSKKFQSIHWLKITKKGLYVYDTWSNPTRGEIIDLKWVTNDFTQFLLIFTREDNGFTTVDISDYKLDGAKMRLMCLDKMRVEFEVSSTETIVQGEDLYLVLVAHKQEKVWLYRYHLNFFKTGGFESILHFISSKVTKVSKFIQSGQNYFLINGRQPNIYQLSHNGTLSSQLHNCGTVEDWLILDVPTYREDVVILARNQDKISLLTWKGSLNGFKVSDQPPCFALDSTMNYISRISDDAVCLALCEWSGAAVLTLGHVPSLLLPCNIDNPDGVLNRPGGLYHFNISLHPSFGPAAAVAKLLTKSQALEEELTMLSQEFEKEGLLEDIDISRGRLVEGFENKWNNLDQCLGLVEEQLKHLASYINYRHQNNIVLNMSLQQGKLTGTASGLLANETIKTSFIGKSRLNPANPAERIIVIESQVVLDENQEFTVRANLKLDSLKISDVSYTEELKSENGYGISPEIDGPPSSFRMKEDMPFHKKIIQDVHH